MRDIKFRIWDKNNFTNKMMYSTLEWFDDLLGLRFNHFDSEPKDLIIMQYTGLKDKNNKEIFEGDIIHIGDPNIKYKITWHDAGLVGKAIVASDMIGLNYWKDRIEVIGNIYENPEWLGVTDEKKTL